MYGVVDGIFQMVVAKWNVLYGKETIMIENCNFWKFSKIDNWFAQLIICFYVSFTILNIKCSLMGKSVKLRWVWAYIQANYLTFMKIT